MDHKIRIGGTEARINTDTSSVLRQELLAGETPVVGGEQKNGACAAAPNHINLFLLQDGSHTKPLL
jgi:hypothetical protein